MKTCKSAYLNFRAKIKACIMHEKNLDFDLKVTKCECLQLCHQFSFEFLRQNYVARRSIFWEEELVLLSCGKHFS